ncbi:MAG TPA: AAC(3) family N-acetyltransferase [Planctomycetota bacterium]|nr:AAC(3) family N-acetyltransferase [Planctomycetota bacterium]
MQFFSEKRVIADIEGISSRTRWMTTPKIMEAARYMAERLKRVPGLRDIAVIEIPADGKTAYGGWVMPKAWDVKSATLSLAQGEERGDCPWILADYHENPFTQMMWSAPTPPEGIVAEVVVVDRPLKQKHLNVKGKIVLCGTLDQVGTPVLAAVAKAGAVALISDHVIPKKGSKEGAYLDDAVQYWNYTNPQWDGEKRLPLFGLTPAVGRKLRALIKQRGTVRLHAKVDSRLYNGTFPLVTARLPGTFYKEFVLTAHMDEPGASDNASGTALAMETLRSLAEFVHARKKPFYHGIRLFCSVEARGLQAYLNTQKYGRQVIGGLNLDMLAYDHTVGRTRFDILPAIPGTPSAMEVLLREGAQREAKKKPEFKWLYKKSIIVNDCHFVGHPYSAPMVCLEQAPDKTYHCSHDTVENLSAPHIRRVGRIVMDTVSRIVGPEYREFLRIGGQAFKEAVAELKSRNSQRRPDSIIKDAEQIWADLIELMPEPNFPPNTAQLKEQRRKGQLIRGHLLPRSVVEMQVESWRKAIRKVKPAARKPGKLIITPAPLSPGLVRKAKALVPLRLFTGYIGFEDLAPALRAELKRKTGLEPGWGGPGWLQWMLDLSNGKRTLLDLYETAVPSHGVKLKQVLDTFDWLQKDGKVRFRPVLTKADVIGAVRRVGVKPGDIIMAHSSLSDFGYLEGGADALIDALLEAVGPRGTVCVPTHSLNWVGRPPYDPKTAPSFTGAVPAVFLKRKEALRSGHPTHSVAAIGPAAKALTSGDGGHLAPQSREGFWGKFVDAGGKVVMLCKLSSNTLLHGGEIWGGTPYPPGMTHTLKNGRRIETLTPNMPWHVHTFDAVHERLERRGRLFSAPLGESKIYSMDAGEAANEMIAYVRENPLAPIRENCNCTFCEQISAVLQPKAVLKRAAKRELARA